MAVKANGARVELHADGSVDLYMSGAVHVHPAANDSVSPMSPAELKPGTRMPEQRIGSPEDRAALVDFLARATKPN